MLYKVDASNVAQYADMLAEGVQQLIKKTGFYINVYPSRRTFALPQWIYDNIAQNVTRTSAQVPGQYRLGFKGAYGGYPFPILSSDPGEAGAQAIWNHESRYTGTWQTDTVCGYTVEEATPVLVSGQVNKYRYDYYLPNGSPATFNGHFYTVLLQNFAPANLAGDEALGYGSANPLVYPIMSWSLLTGQGRVRRTPNLQYDTPSSYVDGICNYDEIFGFNGALDRYDWKLVGKKEMLIPYNNNKIFGLYAKDVHKIKYFDPEAVRWELHRVWVVQATLHPGERNVRASRTIYVDEDSWTIAIADNFDSLGNLVRHHQNVNANFPNLPSNIYQNTISYALDTGSYVSNNGSYADPPYNRPYTFNQVPDSLLTPESMAAQAAY